MKYPTINKFKFGKDGLIVELVRMAYLVIGKRIVLEIDLH